jgi:hypothetical protein
MSKNKKIKSLEIKKLSEMDILSKLRLAVITIFTLSSLSFVVLILSDFVISAVLVLMSYFMIFALMIKLLMIKKL